FDDQERSAIKMISCPDGTPLKLTQAGIVWNKLPRELGLSDKGYFIHNLDNSGGSSGAPIFDAQSGQVIGIQSGGDDNYVEKDGIIYQVKGDDNGLNSNINSDLSGEYGSKIDLALILSYLN
ncbi:MAG: trypsin-like peptidase domain-containing protein, partial [Bacteroidota bacterium]